MKPIVIVVVAAMLLFLYNEVVLLLCVVIAIAQSFVRWCPDLDQRDGRAVVRTRSNLHRRYRLRWFTDYPFFLTLPRMPR